MWISLTSFHFGLVNTRARNSIYVYTDVTGAIFHGILILQDLQGRVTFRNRQIPTGGKVGENLLSPQAFLCRSGEKPEPTV